MYGPIYYFLGRKAGNECDTNTDKANNGLLWGENNHLMLKNLDITDLLRLFIVAFMILFQLYGVFTFIEIYC